MTQEYDNNLRGVLFKNDRKETEAHPLYKGSCEIEGIQFWISAWLKEGQKGKFMSLAFTPKEQQAPAPAPQRSAPAQQQRRGRDEDSDIPF